MFFLTFPPCVSFITNSAPYGVCNANYAFACSRDNLVAGGCSVKKYACSAASECGASSMWDAQCEGGFDPALNANYFDQTTKQALNYGDVSALDIEAPCFYTPDKCPTGTICYRKNEFWSQCKKSCEPGFHEGFGIYSLMPWACTPVTVGYLQTRKKISEVIEMPPVTGDQLTPPATEVNLACDPNQVVKARNVQQYITQNPSLDSALSKCLDAVNGYYQNNGITPPSVQTNNLNPLSTTDQNNLANAFASVCGNKDCVNLIAALKSARLQSAALNCELSGFDYITIINNVIDTLLNPWNQSGCASYVVEATPTATGKPVEVNVKSATNTAAKGLETGVLVGIVVGAVAFLIILIVIIVVLVKKNESTAASSTTSPKKGTKTPSIQKMEGGVTSPKRQSPRRS